MKILSVKLVNFNCFEESKFTFTPGLNVVVLPNGGGKSSLIEGIGFTLYGARALESAVETYIREGSVGASLVQLSGEFQRETFVLTRHLKPARVLFKWKDLTIKKVGELSDFWKKRLIPLHLFKATICSNQREATLLAQATATTRRKLISELLRFNVVINAIDSLTGPRVSRATLISQKQIEELENELSSLQEVPIEWESMLREQLYLKTQLAQYDPQVEKERNSLQSRLSSLTTLYDLLSRATAHEYSQCPVCGATQFDSTLLSQRVRKVEEELTVIKQKLHQLPYSPSLTEEQRQKIKPELNIEDCKRTLSLLERRKQVEASLISLKELQQQISQSRNLSEARQLLRDFLDSVSVPLLTSISRLTSRFLVGSPFREVTLTSSFDLEVDGRPFSKLSVGQRDFVATVFRIAVSYITSSLFNIEHFPLLLDSIGDSLDETFFSLLMSILSTEVTKLFPQIILTTHHS